MNKKSLATGIIIAALALPFAASALSVGDIQQQIKDLLSRVSTLQAQLNVQGGASSSPAQVAPAMPRYCAILTHSLTRGQRGDDVRALQEFLSGAGFLNASATGYFGPATASAVAKWQSSEGVQAVGTFGPRSLERLKIRCSNNGLLNVSPNSGSAPLTVTVTSKIGDATDYQPSAADGRDTMIDFGDGSARQWVHCASNGQDIYPARCQTPQSYTHTYTMNGTYAVSLMKSGGMCMGGCTDETLATERVVVGTQTSVPFSADPQSGSAPLFVTFTTQIGINDVLPTVDFGDGSSAATSKGSCIAITAIVGGQGGIRCAASVSHTYAQNGSYTAVLMSNGTATAKTAVQVDDTSSQNGTLSADPNYGAAPLAVNFTYQPRNDDNGQAKYWIEFGDGTGQIMDLHQIYCFRAPCISPSTATHAYTSAGTYDAYVETYIGCQHTNPRCMIATMPLAHATVTVTGNSTSGAPSISQFSGPTTLSVNEIGTWKITASDPSNGTLSYSILWGDEWPAGAVSANRAMAPQESIQQNTTFTHSYSNPGTYNVAVTVTNAAGKESRSTASVQVSQTACTTQYAPVCARPNGCANTCAAGMYCTLQCQLYQPQTYSNRCQMNNSNATFMHEGACTGNEGYLQ